MDVTLDPFIFNALSFFLDPSLASLAFPVGQSIPLFVLDRYFPIFYPVYYQFRFSSIRSDLL